MALAQQTRLVRVDSPLGAEVLQLQRMEGREELGRPFAYELELISENPDLPLDGLLGKPASLALELHDAAGGISTASSPLAARDPATASSPATRSPCAPGCGC